MSDEQFQDRFERAFNQRIPRKVAQTFTDDQRAAVRTAFGGERWDGHPIDFRGVIPFLRWYFVFISGPDKRTKRRVMSNAKPKRSIFGRIIRALLLILMLALLAIMLFLS